MIGDLLIVDRDLSLQMRLQSAIAIWSKDPNHKNTITIFLAFFSNQPFAGQIFQKCQTLRNEFFFKKRLVALNKLAYETYEKYLSNSK